MFSTTVFAGITQMYQNVLARKNVATPPVGDYEGNLINEKCEGTGTPANWTDDTNDTADWDESTIFGEGSQSFKAYWGGSYRSFTANGELYGLIMFRITSDYDADDRFIYLLDGGQNGVGDSQMTIRVDGSSHLTVATEATTTSGATTINADTWYYLWLYYKKSSGSNDGIAKIWVSTTSTKPESEEVSIIDNSETQDIDYIHLSDKNNGADTYYFDNIQIGTNTH